MNGAESLLRTARAAGIDVCFANPGTTEMPFVAALDAVPGIRPVLGVFEACRSRTPARTSRARWLRWPTRSVPRAGPGRLPRTQPPPPPSGCLDAAALPCAVARALPDHAIVVDEGATSSLALHDALAWAAPHSWLTLTGGAIAPGLPCATGAAIACSDRKVVAFQADGSALYTLQALWTQARESLDVTTVICANHAYRILQVEMLRAGAGAGGAAARTLTELADPAPDWVKLASGMACRPSARPTRTRWSERSTARSPSPGRASSRRS